SNLVLPIGSATGKTISICGKNSVLVAEKAGEGNRTLIAVLWSQYSSHRIFQLKKGAYTERISISPEFKNKFTVSTVSLRDQLSFGLWAC
ncbi:hypothetical protein ACFL5Z_15175, partial [Planctomycetota bacterium]